MRWQQLEPPLHRTRACIDSCRHACERKQEHILTGVIFIFKGISLTPTDRKIRSICDNICVQPAPPLIKLTPVQLRRNKFTIILREREMLDKPLNVSKKSMAIRSSAFTMYWFAILWVYWVPSAIILLYSWVLSKSIPTSVTVRP